MASVPEAVLVGISSPYARRGELWRAFAEHFGKDGDPVLVWQADTRSMNPSVDAAIVGAAYKADEPRAAAEYGAQFRREVEHYLSREQLDAVTAASCRPWPTWTTWRSPIRAAGVPIASRSASRIGTASAWWWTPSVSA